MAQVEHREQRSSLRTPSFRKSELGAKQRGRFTFHFELVEAGSLSVSNGTKIHLEWKKSKELSSSSSKSVAVQNKLATWTGEKFTVSSTLTRDTRTDIFEPKHLYLVLKESPSGLLKSKKRVTGTYKLNLAQFVKDGEHRPVLNFPDKDKETQTAASVTLKVTSEWPKGFGERSESTMDDTLTAHTEGGLTEPFGSDDEGGEEHFVTTTSPSKLSLESTDKKHHEELEEKSPRAVSAVIVTPPEENKRSSKLIERANLNSANHPESASKDLLVKMELLKEERDTLKVKYDKLEKQLKETQSTVKKLKTQLEEKETNSPQLSVQQTPPDNLIKEINEWKAKYATISNELANVKRLNQNESTSVRTPEASMEIAQKELQIQVVQPAFISFGIIFFVFIIFRFLQ
eukprot:TRINITY_DN9197_c0_g1_i1.p1 TRINITY_DN9197_c0_g1~~TRINITY_DN9197_c0_g1_i1.p1  ORF type:complete len:413 (-),score=116.97 TRINITY_DN9197_c0_g1_i1:179-1384(-)